MEFIKNKWTAIKAINSYRNLIFNPSSCSLDDFFNLAFGVVGKQGSLTEAIDHYQKSPEGKEAFERRYRIHIRLDELKQLPVETLGYQYYQMVARLKLDTEAFQHFKATDDESYILAHLYETHDLWHLLGDFDTSFNGELALQGFYMSQCPGRLSPALISAGLLNISFRDMKKGKQRMHAIARGFMIGYRARPLFGIPWNDYWDWSLDDVRKHFHIHLD